MAEATDVIPVLRMHLQEIAEALDWAHGYFAAMDLAEGYRSGAPVPRNSRSTKLMEKAANHVDGYLSVGEDDGT